MAPATYRIKATGVEVEAELFTGDNYAEVQALVGVAEFDTLHLDGRDSEVVAHLHNIPWDYWFGVKPGMWIVLGPDGALRFDAVQFDEDFEEVTA